MPQLVARDYRNGKALRVHYDRSIIAMEALSDSANESALPYVAPAFVDLQVNGFSGHDFNSPDLTIEQVQRICQSLDQFGVGRLCPTCTTQSFSLLARSLRTVSNAIDSLTEVRSRTAGIHLEGPYISRDDGPRGAHPREHVRPPDWEEFCRLQDAAQGKIRVLTMSPEYENSDAFIERVTDTGVIVSIGHTAADGSQIQQAVQAGARMSTHLGNGAHGMIRRHPNYIWDQLAEDQLVTSLIADGFHLPDSVLQTFIRAKGLERVVLVSDLVGIAGLPEGEYQSALGPVEVLSDGRVVIAGQRQLLAGASQPLHHGVGTVMRAAGLDLAAVIPLAAQRPAALIGLNSWELHVGGCCDLVVFDVTRSGQLEIHDLIKL